MEAGAYKEGVIPVVEASADTHTSLPSHHTYVEVLDRMHLLALAELARRTKLVVDSLAQELNYGLMNNQEGPWHVAEADD